MGIRSRLGWIGAIAFAFLSTTTQAAKVYVMSSGYNVQDTTVLSSLAAAGHTGVLGVQFSSFDGTQSLAGYDAVLLQVNYNWNAPDMPAGGQNQLVAFVSQGGGLVTTEWILWDIAASAKFQILDPILPSVATTSYNGDAVHHFQQVTANATINSGMPTEFDLPGDNVAGSETNVPGVKSGATIFYMSTVQANVVGLSGWDSGLGRVVQFSQTVGQGHLTDALGFRLLGNVIEYVSHGAGSQQLNPDTVTVRLGQINSGGLAQIADIDGQAMRVCKFIVPNQQVALITVEIEGNCPITSPTSMQFRTYSKMNVSGSFSETVDLYDWNLGNFSSSATSTVAIGTSYMAAGVAADTPVSRFVSGSHRVRARYRIRQTGPASSAFWCNDLDQAVWFVK